MSNISNTHSVQSYVVGKTKPLDGQRLSKITYKTDKSTGIKPDSKCVSIPVTKWEEVEPHISSLKGEFLTVVHKAQDAIVRNKVEAGAKEITSEAIALPAVISYLLEESGRLTGEVIREWFKDTLSDTLLVTFASKLGIAEDAAPTKEQEEKLAKIIKGYEDSFAKLASGAATFNEMQKTNMLKALDFIEEDDALKSRFVDRLTKKEVKEDDLLMAL